MKNYFRKFNVLLIFSFILLGIFFSCKTTSDKEKNENTQEEPKVQDKKYRIVGYVAGYRELDFSSIAVEKLTHINYAFANIIDGKIKFGAEDDPIDKVELKTEDLETLNSLKSRNPKLKILVSVGGWTWSGNFSDVALTEESRTKFAKSAIVFLKKYKLDGIDLDWEYPNQTGAGNTHRHEDIKNFTLLLKAVRVELDKESEKDGKTGDNKYLLTIATGADEAYINNTELGEASKYLDFLNIMTYDFHNGLHSLTGHHANLNPSGFDEPNGSNILHSVQIHIDANVPLHKIVLGIPFYGRFWTKVNKDKNGLYQESGSKGDIIYYRKIISDKLSNSNYVRYWDESAKVPYLWNEKEAEFISYEDAESIKHKLEYLKNKGLSGVMFWEYSDDYDQQLLNAVYEGLK